DAFQQLKTHPFVSSLLRDATLINYGAKALPESGWHSIPRLTADGVIIAGDAGGFLDSLRLKGIHLAMRTGMLAGETAFAAVRAGRPQRRAGVRRPRRASAPPRARGAAAGWSGAAGGSAPPLPMQHTAFSRRLPAGVRGSTAFSPSITGVWPAL